MSTPKVESVPVPASTDLTPRRGLGRRLASAAAAAAIVTSVTFASAMLRDQGGEDWHGPVGLPSADTGDTGRNYHLNLRTAQSHPRLLIDESGWRMRTVYDLAAAHGKFGSPTTPGNWR